MIGAFVIGLIGSFHCIGMCGPIMVAMTKGAGNIQSFVIYHLSRIAIYMLFGLLAGILGVAFNTFAFQQSASIIAGLMIIGIYGFPKWRNQIEGIYYRSSFYSKAKKIFIPLYQSKFKWFGAGILNGLLPCGLIYLALAGAMMQGGVLESSGYMLAFGFGTLPALGMVLVFRNKISLLIKRFPNAVTMIAMTAGLIMVLRGVLIQSPNFNELITLQVSNAISFCGF
jgi:sulfite exporter TauE/SafE